MRKTVSILGLGWLGLPLAKSLLEQGHIVKGTVTNLDKLAEIEHLGIDVSVLNLFNDELVCTDNKFFDTDVLVINFPPKRVEKIETLYPNQLRQLLPFILQNGIKKVLFVSSTSVYPEENRTVTENDVFTPDKPSGIACLKAENVLRLEQHFSTTVIRFGGLIGADRNPYRFLQRGVKNGQGNKPVNLIHLDDCIGIIEHVIKNNIWGEIINGTCPVHPTREEFYQTAAKVAGVEAPLFDYELLSSYKKVSSKKLVDQLGYRFKYESPVDYLMNKKSTSD